MKRVIAQILAKETGLQVDEIEKMIERPSSELGDFAFPCFALAKVKKKSPLLIAEELKEKIRLPKEISKLEVKSGYLNFFVEKNAFSDNLVKEILKEKGNYGKSLEGKGKNIVIDMSSPNIAKPFGIGHLRSTIIGNSLSKICEELGFRTIKVNYLGDWGTQFGKLIYGLKKFGDEKDMKKDPIKYLLDIYVKVNDEKYEDDARKEFRKLEQGDKQNLEIWKELKKISLKEFNEIYKILGVEFDEISGESLYNDKVYDIIDELADRRLLKESQGAKIVDLEKYGLGVSLIKKNDGATLYATRDIAAVIGRYKKYKFYKMIYEVGNEQRLHFKQFFKILELLGYNFYKDCIHVSHGLYLDNDGKKFATRKGKTVFMKDILNETIELAKKTIIEKNPKLKNKDEVARKVAIAAIFYGDLKNNRTNDMVFDIERFLDFEGDTGPYLMYSYARASSVLKKSKKKKRDFKMIDLKQQEVELIKKLSEYPEVLQNSYKNLNPSEIANYTYALAKRFNEFYHSCPVLGSKEEGFRLSLVEAFTIVMKKCLNLLGIEEVGEM